MAEMQGRAGRSAEQAAEELASGLAEQRRRVQALAQGAQPERHDMATVLGEIDIVHEELRVAEEELRAQQRRLDELLAERADPRAWRRSVIASLPVPALVTDAHGTVLEMNPAAWALLGRRLDEVADRPLHELVSPAHHERLQEALVPVPGSATSRPVTLSLLAADGSARTVDLVVGFDEPHLAGSPVTWVVGSGRASERATERDDAAGLRTAQAVAEMCRLPLQDGADTRSVLARAASLVEMAVPDSDGVSITLGPPDQPETQATDNLWASEVDGAQLRAAEGPCLHAYRTGSVVVSEDLGADERWPRLGRLAGPLGVGGVLGCPLRTDSHSLGVLNLYSRRARGFDDHDVRLAELLVSAVLAVVQETRDRNELTQLSTQLREALESRAVIDQAKGILMSRNRVGPEQAFAQLVASSRRSNVKVRDVAHLVVEDASRRAGEQQDPDAAP